MENFLASNYVLQFVPGELTVKARDITITKTVDVTKAFVGDKLTYTITVTNTGDVDLQDVAVVDEMLGIEQVIGELKAGNTDYVLHEIKTLKRACGDKILKVIIETCLLTDEEKVTMCKLVTESGADFIKTSTGFSTAGATFADIELFAKNVGPNVQMKAAGGISSLADAEKFIELGATRLGTSRIIKILKDRGCEGQSGEY